MQLWLWGHLRITPLASVSKNGKSIYISRSVHQLKNNKTINIMLSTLPGRFSIEEVGGLATICTNRQDKRVSLAIISKTNKWTPATTNTPSEEE